jgi:alginate O-acetyltransferase complex protein AlgI
VFKYAGFLGANINAVLAALGLGALPVPDVRCRSASRSSPSTPSRTWSTCIAPRRHGAEAAPCTPRSTCCCFPQLIAGPIIRYREIADQLAARRCA